MKKYLITGTLAIVLGGSLASCSHEENFEGSLVAEKIVTFEQVFKKEFGEIDPNHDWGFGNATQTAAARGLTRSHNKNSNQWASQGWIIPDPLTDAQKDKVRRYFQQNRQPQGISLNFSNFFVQQVYEGHTNLDGSETDEIYLSGADAADDRDPSVVGGDHMDKLTAGYDHDHINDFNNADRGEINVQNNDLSGEHMDAITLMVNSSTACFGFYNSNESAQYDDKFVIIPGDDIQAWDGTGGADADVSGMFFVGFDFECNQTGWITYTDWEGKEVTELNSNTNQYLVTPDENGVVLPNDHTGGKTFKIGAADGYYSDWIVRITEGLKRESTDPDEIQIPVIRPGENTGSIPVYETTTVYEKYNLIDHGRVFCEDLGSMDASDFDYNDVVFDAYIYEKVDSTVKTYTYTKDNQTIVDSVKSVKSDTPTYSAQIVLLAAGGTLQLKLADNYEVHGEFGTGTETLVNTATDNTNAHYNPYIPYHAPVFLGPVEGIKSIKDIEIDVKYTHDKLRLQAEEGKAPHKFCVPVGTPWALERCEFSEAYKDFKDYVSSKDVEFWKGEKDESLLYGDIEYEHPAQTKAEVKSGPTTLETPSYYIEGETTLEGGYNGEDVLIRVRH